ncbi:polysaccharide deacetylase family protein [Paenibacillus sp. PR3]|uniref:Polysaccharide deacetylase family protein n=1 Tax=Paenibacillus terricola TaxID=2763503 RepID=A0ABR8N2C1_9BACL|nr:polysaccharide deacetylase family protein [Paenibacillus terricola]MBD3922301.1 polysaccharide deacetylase family protein [Paenibacillus terricola]
MNTIQRTIMVLSTLFLLMIPTVHTAAAASKSEYDDKVAVLMYHHMTDGSNKPNPDIISTTQFNDQLSYLQQKGYNFISLRQFIDYMNGGSVPPNAVLVTFDDGYESFSNLAYPILKSKRIPSVAFIITSATDNKKYGYIPHMTHAELEQVTADNLAEVQCHTNKLHYKVDNRYDALTARLTVNGVTETDEQHKKRILDDFAACKDQLAPINKNPIDTFAYPYGMHDQESMDLVREANIQYAFTVREDIATRQSNWLQIPRINGGSPSITPADLEAAILRTAHPYSKDAIIHKTKKFVQQAPHRKRYWALGFLVLIGIGYMGYRKFRKRSNPFPE